MRPFHLQDSCRNFNETSPYRKAVRYRLLHEEQAQVSEKHTIYLFLLKRKETNANLWFLIINMNVVCLFLLQPTWAPCCLMKLSVGVSSCSCTACRSKLCVWRWWKVFIFICSLSTLLMIPSFRTRMKTCGFESGTKQMKGFIVFSLFNSFVCYICTFHEPTPTPTRPGPCTVRKV